MVLGILTDVLVVILLLGALAWGIGSGVLAILGSAVGLAVGGVAVWWLLPIVAPLTPSSPSDPSWSTSSMRGSSPPSSFGVRHPSVMCTAVPFDLGAYAEGEGAVFDRREALAWWLEGSSTATRLTSSKDGLLYIEGVMYLLVFSFLIRELVDALRVRIKCGTRLGRGAPNLPRARTAPPPRSAAGPGLRFLFPLPWLGPFTRHLLGQVFFGHLRPINEGTQARRGRLHITQLFRQFSQLARGSRVVDLGRFRQVSNVFDSTGLATHYGHKDRCNTFSEAFVNAATNGISKERI